MVIVLYRCPTPTDLLCPCGRVARALRGAGIAYDEVRVPYRKRHRDEVQELTGQLRVPVLATGDDAICDSHRIVEYVQRRAAGTTA